MYLTTPTARVRSTSPFDQAFTQLARSFSSPTRQQAGPIVSGVWVDGAYQLTVDAPGTPRDLVDVSVAGRTLTVTIGENWSRQIRLAPSLDAEQVSAAYVDGRLTVTVGATAAAEARSIEIGASPAPTAPAVEAVAADGPTDQSAPQSTLPSTPQSTEDNTTE